MRRFAILILPLILIACAPNPEQATVTSVVDGDTLHVRLANGKEETVRIVGIDTPETVDPRKPVGCYGPEASAYVKDLLTGKDVILEPKPDEDRDKYNRLLRYVLLDGTDVDAMLVREGFAKNYPYFPHPRQAQYKALEKAAKKEGKGLWGACQGI